MAPEVCDVVFERVADFVVNEVFVFWRGHVMVCPFFVLVVLDQTLVHVYGVRGILGVFSGFWWCGDEALTLYPYGMICAMSA